jgi:hypothetical protein
MSDEFKERTLVKRFQQRREPSSWKRVNSHEYRPVFDDPDDAVKAVEQDIMNFASKGEMEGMIDSKGRSASQYNKNDKSQSSEKDDAFIEAFLQQKQTDLADVDEDDDYTEMLLT